MTTPEQQAQGEQWREEFAVVYGNRPSSLLYGGQPPDEYDRELAIYLAGREAQQREGAEALKGRDAMIGRYLETVQKQCADLRRNEATITQLQAQVKELEARLGAGEPDNACSIGASSPAACYLVPCQLGKVCRKPIQPPAAQVPDEPVAWRSRHVNYVGWTLSEWEMPMREGQEQQPLYLDRRCAAIPDSLHMRDVTHPKATNPEEAWMYATGWNDCRAAMLATHKESKT